MERQTYRIRLLNLSFPTVEEINTILQDVSMSSYTITCEMIANEVCSYTTLITILKTSLASAKPVCTKICNLLSLHDIKYKEEEATLYWDENRVYMELD